MESLSLKINEKKSSSPLPLHSTPLVGFFYESLERGDFASVLTLIRLRKARKGISEHFDFNPSRMSRLLFECFWPRLVWENGAERLRTGRNYFKGGRRGALMTLWTRFTSSRTSLRRAQYGLPPPQELSCYDEQINRLESRFYGFAFITGSSCARARQFASQISIKSDVEITRNRRQAASRDPKPLCHATSHTPENAKHYLRSDPSPPPGSLPFPARPCSSAFTALLLCCVCKQSLFGSSTLSEGEERRRKLLNSSLPYYISGQTQ
jgi:hypothetical protein